MIKIIKCFTVYVLLVAIWTCIGVSILKLINAKKRELERCLILGFFVYFFIVGVFLTPIAVARLSVTLGAVIVSIITVLLAVASLVYSRKEIISTVINIKHIDQLGVICVLAFVIVTVLSIFTAYVGWDINFYVGQVASFVQYDSFWTHDVQAGGVYVDCMPSRYTLSCFYPYFACLCKIFSIEARMMAMYVQKAFCVTLSTCALWCLGTAVFREDEGKVKLFIIFSLILTVLCAEYHTSSTFMIVRGYEAKGFCVAVICPILLAMLIEIVCDYTTRENWLELGIVTWPSMLISMSSMAIVPLAIVILIAVLLIYYRKIRGIILPGLICMLPNLLLVGIYVVTK